MVNYMNDIMTQLETFKVVPVAKFFPASQYGGVKTINAIGAAFPNI